MTLNLSQIDFSTVSVYEKRNDTKPEILDVSCDDSGITVKARIIDEYFGTDGFFNIDTTDESSFKLEIDVSIFFSVDSLIVEDLPGEDRIHIESDEGVISNNYTFKYVCPELTEEHVTEYINEIWIDYQDDFNVTLEAFMNR